MEFKTGFTWVTFLALLYAIFVFVPSNIYLRLMTNQSVAVAWFVTLIWVELSKIAGKPLTKQEALIILIMSGSIMFFTPMNLVMRDYFVNSDIFKLFGLADEVPTWWAPSLSSGVHLRRTFFDAAWIAPIGVQSLYWAMMTLFSLGLGLMAREFFIEVEDLPFPVQTYQAQGVMAVTAGEEEKHRVDLLFVFGLVGFIWGFLLYALPFVIEAYTGQRMTFIPIPYVDMTVGMQGIEQFLPGAMFGVATDISFIALAFVLPLSTLVCIIVGSFVVWFFGNWIIVSNWLDWFPNMDIDLELPGVQSWWTPGMNLQLIYQRSYLYFWVVPLIGFMLAAGLAPVFYHYKMFGRAIRSMIRPVSKERKRLPETYPFTTRILPLIALGTVAPVVFFTVLAPDFPLLVVVAMQAFFPLAITLVNCRMLGETGIAGAEIPTNVIIYATGYSGVNAWFANEGFSTPWGESWLGQFKMAQLTEVRASSVIKAFLITAPIAALVGYLYMQLFWSLGPIPSGMYPGASIFWPVSATNFAVWIKGTYVGLFNPTWLVIAFVVGVVVYAVTQVAALPISVIAIAAGAATIVPFAVTYAIGIVIVMIIRHFVGIEWWNRNKNICSVGLVMGESIAITIAISISLVIHSIWLLPI